MKRDKSENALPLTRILAKWRQNPRRKGRQVCKFFSRRKFIVAATAPICKPLAEIVAVAPSMAR